MNTKWTKLKHEKTGTLEVYYGDIVKNFVSKYRSWAMKKAKGWYIRFTKESV